MVTLLCGDVFRITHQEMIKGIMRDGTYVESSSSPRLHCCPMLCMVYWHVLFPGIIEYKQVRSRCASTARVEALPRLGARIILLGQPQTYMTAVEQQAR